MSSLSDCRPAGKRLKDDIQKESDQKVKRNRLEKNDVLNGEDRKKKTESYTRTRCETNAQSKLRANKFLRIHLQILKALYQDGALPASMSEDCHVEEKYWEFIKGFLKERDAIKRTTKRAQCMRGIHEEAMEFEKNVSAFPVINNDIIAHQVSPQFVRIGNRKSSLKGARSNLSFRSSALMLITQPSPLYHPHRPSHSKRNSNFVNNTQESDNLEEDGGNAFGIVSGLLKRKRHLASRHLNQRTTDLRALVKETQNRIEILNSQLIAERDKEKSLFIFEGGTEVNYTSSEKSREDFAVAKEECEDCLLRIETKIGLWKLLLQDLFGTMLIK